VRRSLRLALARLVQRPELSIAHDFRPPPYGGSNQFMLALRGELRRRGLRVGTNVVTGSTRACLLNAHVFDARELRRMLHPGCRVVHRVDGPLATYRGFDDGTDLRTSELNAELAQTTIFQSRYSLKASTALGLAFREPVVIPNAVDPAIFYPASERTRVGQRKIRLITTSWSDNPNKGGEMYLRLERLLDWERYDWTFVGRIGVTLERIRVVGPLPSEKVAELLRAHDVFITASICDPASNALLEALACGLPALYADSGGHAEIAGEAGFAFSDSEQVPQLLDRLAEELELRRARIHLPTLAETADRYLAALGLEA
jgi:glycosyltransferase involved in cell wall biosynthesis